MKTRSFCAKTRLQLNLLVLIKKGFMQKIQYKYNRNVTNLKFAYSILLSGRFIDKNFRFLLFEGPQILGKLYKSLHHSPFHNVIESSSVNVAHRWTIVRMFPSIH